MGQWFPPFYGKSKFYYKKKQKALAKIAKLQIVVAECEKAIASEAGTTPSSK